MNLVRPLLMGLLCVACGARTPLGLVVEVGADAQPSDASADALDSTVPRDAEAANCPFGLSATVAATMEITADDAYVLYVNGALVDGTVRPWSSPQVYQVTLLRHPGQRNVIAIAGTNQQNTDGRDRGILADLRVRPNMTEVHVLTDATWRVSKVLVPSWFAVGFDASGWPNATDEGPYGEAPWGKVFSGPSNAHWLWSYDSSAPASQKVLSETVYVRRDFYFDVSGTPRDTPGTCP